MMQKTKVGVLLSGSGVYDGSEIHEATLSLLELDKRGFDVKCFAPNITQLHVVDHTNGSEQPESRNVLVESARIARGNIANVAEALSSDISALVIPGGFGVAKNLCTWALHGPDCTIDEDVQMLIQSCVRNGKLIVALCMGPTLVARALKDTGVHPHLTVGTTEEPSPYDIAEINSGMEKIGARIHMNTIREVTVDVTNNIISAPCYMMEASISEVHENIKSAMTALTTMLVTETVDA